jgi:membrane fusion protein (multidrug efflux system)
MREAIENRAIRAACIVMLVLLGACANDKAKKKKNPPPLVSAATVQKHLFVNVIEAVGTAKANEQVTIASSVTERVERVLFDDGMAVAKGQLLAELTKGQEDAALHGALAAEKQADTQYKRIRSIYDRGFATQVQLDLQLAAMERARADAAQIRAEIVERMIRAPFAGYTGLRNISAGAIVTAGTPLVTVSDISRIKLDFTVPETGLTSLKIGQPIAAVAAAFPGESFTGRISSIDPVIDPSSRAVMVRAILPNPGVRLKPGMLLSVRVKLGERTADAVPELAVAGDGGTRYVFLVGPGAKARRAEVKTGLRDAGLIEVKGLPPKTNVVVEGVVKIADGMMVRLAGAVRKPKART